MNKGFQDSKKAISLTAKHSHDRVARVSEQTVNSTDFKSADQQTCQTEGNTFGELRAQNGGFKTVAEIDVDDAIRDGVEHQIARMSVAETEDVAEHGHDSEGADVRSAAIEPRFSIRALHPHEVGEIHSIALLEGAIEDFEFLHEAQLAIRCLVFLVVGDVSELSQSVRLTAHLGSVAAVFENDLVESVAVLDPLDDTRSVGERNDSHRGDDEFFARCGGIGFEESVGEADELDDTLVLTQIFQTLQ